MKLITLNIWGGTLFQPLIDFFQIQKDKFEIFCLQEVWNHNQVSDKALRKAPRGIKVDILSHLMDALPGFQVFFAPAQDNAEGLAFFVKNVISIENQGDIFVFRSRDAMVGNDGRTLGRNLQYIQFKREKRPTPFVISMDFGRGMERMILHPGLINPKKSFPF